MPHRPRRVVQRLLACTLSLLSALVVVGVTGTSAQAADVFLSRTASTSWQVDGVVYSTLIVGDTVYVGGQFGNAVAPDGTLVPRKNLAAFTLSTGELVTSFRADAASNVRAFATDGRSLFVGGAFKTLGGATRSSIGKVDLVTGAVDPGFAPVADESVRALVVKGSALYVGGNFTHIDGAVRNRIAKLDPSTGAADAAFTANASSSVYALKLSPTGDRLYVGGNFATMGTVARSGMAAVDPATGTVVGPAFASAAKPTFALAVDEDGSSLFASGGAATNATGAWNSSTGVRKWRVVTDGDNQAMVYFRGEVYFGFHDGYQGNTELKLLAADAATGALDPTFRPTFDQFWGIWAVDVSERGLVVGGDFTTAGGLSTRGFARFLPTSAPPPPPPSTRTFLGPNSQWGYWDQGTRPAGWESAAFDSSSWPHGVPRLGYGDTFDDTIVGYGPSSTNKYLTTYFRSSFDLTTLPDRMQLQLSADDGAVVYVNGTEVARDNLSTAAPTNTTTALSDRSGGAETALASYALNSSTLKVGTNVVAVEVHQFSKGSSDMGLDVQLDGLYDNVATTNQSPTASFTSSVNGVVGTFDAAGSSDPDGRVASYTWDFGDGTTDTGVATTHSYATSGDYRVTLTVLDDKGARGTLTRTVSAVSPEQTVIAKGSSWRWKFDGAALPTGWSTAGDSAAWPSGGAPLGFGDASVITKIDTFATTAERPRAAYFMKSFQVANPAKVSRLVLSTVADDGVVIYVNGTEVNRTNMPTGTVTPTTNASTSVRTANATKVTVNASPDLLVAGTNVISAETHLNARTTTDATFDLTATVLTGNARPTSAFTSSVNQLAASFDGSGSADSDGTIASYAWDFGDGTTGTGPSPTHTYAVSGTYPVTLTVTDDDGAVGSLRRDVTAVTADPVVIRAGSQWRWRYLTTAPPVAWTSNGFDGSSWASGKAPLGFGDASVATGIDTFATPTARPVAAQYLNTFQVADRSKVTSLTLTTLADDGLVVYVNGTEVARSNMPAGTIAHTTNASTARSTATAKAAPVVVTVPAGLLVDGTNTVAVETHVNYRSTPSMTFDLSAELRTSP